MRKRSFAILLLALGTLRPLWAGPAPAASAGFDAYIKALETRLAVQHASANGFLAPAGSRIERLTPNESADFSGASLHHWRGTTFSRGAAAADFERVMRDIGSYPRYFSPQVVQARLLGQSGDRLQASMRVRQKQVISVVMDTSYDITFGRLDARHGYSLSKSTRIAEIDAAGSRVERELSDSEEHGFLWRLNTYWSYEERDGGLYLQIETVSLARSVPTALNWLIQPYVTSIPKESLEFTLQSVSKVLLSERGSK